MATPGQTYSTLVRAVWMPMLRQEIFFNNWLFDQSHFRMETPVPGDTINIGYEYSVSTNTAAAQYDDPMV